MPEPFVDSAGQSTQTFPSFSALEQIMDACPYVSVVLNEQRRIVYFNRALLTLAGPVQEGALFGRLFGQAVQCSHAFTGEGCGSHEACQTCGASLAVKDGLRGFTGTRECRLVRDVEGKTEWLDVLVSVSPIAVAGERFVACYVRDISDEKRRDVLERIFFHDILNSATGVELLASALHTMVAGDASVFATQIRACAGQMVEEIQSQQQLLSAERDELAVSILQLTTGSLIRDLVESARGSSLAEQREVRVATKSADIAIYTDPSILRRVLRNMLANALEAAQPDETVELGCRDRGQEVEFWVQNPGVMPEAVRQQIFQRSFSTKGIGRGLGTYSIKLLTERYLKGAVTFRSSKSEGTRFIARYPKHPHGVKTQAAS
jgi:signal transduction histidine kinase